LRAEKLFLSVENFDGISTEPDTWKGFYEYKSSPDRFIWLGDIATHANAPRENEAFQVRHLHLAQGIQSIWHCFAPSLHEEIQ
jgi:hypothetical protein